MKPLARVAAVFIMLVLASVILGAGAMICALAINALKPAKDDIKVAAAEKAITPPVPPPADTVHKTDTTNQIAMLDTAINKPVTEAVAVNPTPKHDTVAAAPPKTKKTTTVIDNNGVDHDPSNQHQLSKSDGDALLSLIKNEEMMSGVKVHAISVEVTPESNGKEVARQIIQLLKKRGYNVSSTIGFVSVGTPLKGINTSISKTGFMDIEIGNFK